MPQNPYRRPDHRTRQAHAQGYPARSVFKLEEIDRRVRLLRPGMTVLDLGAAPGSWTLYASQKIGKNGRVLSIDLKALRQAMPTNVTFVQADALEAVDPIFAQLAPYDVVLSDMAPDTIGDQVADRLRSAQLYLRALDVARRLAAPGGVFVGKIFMGQGFEEAREETRAVFKTVKIIRPEGTRQRSVETFLIGLDKRPELLANEPNPTGS